MTRAHSFAALAALALAACGAYQAEDAAPPGETQGGTEASSQTAPGEADGIAALIAGDWRCKAQDNIPIGVLKVQASGAYEFIVVKNTTWDPKPGDSGNGKGKLGAPEGLMKPLSGPLADTYEIVSLAREDSQWGVRIYLNNDFGTLLHCGPADQEG